ncbi:MAG: flavodoxin domain-containing protein [Tissierellia bacterium]|nr:flavodoxin domain-containing protein [Tissierellia bacterium]
MKIAILYASVHHKNTENLILNATKNLDIDLYNVEKIDQNDFSHYDLVAFASGIYAFKVHKSIYQFLDKKPILPHHAILIYTSGTGGDRYIKSFENKLKKSNIRLLDTFECKGFDTFFILKLVGGMNKGKPDEKDVKDCKNFLVKYLEMDISSLE